jgi:hypothetical protein
LSPLGSLCLLRTRNSTEATQRGRRNGRTRMKNPFIRQKITGVIVGILGFVIQTWSANAQYLIATNESALVVVPGQTQVRFTRFYQAYPRSFSCGPYSMNYVEGVVITTPGIPQGTLSAQVFTDSVGLAGHVFTVCYSFPCEGYQILGLDLGCP